MAKAAGLSPCVYKLLEHWSWGSSCALEVCDLARSITNSFGTAPDDVGNLASCGSFRRQAANKQRDLLRLAGQSLKAPDPFYVKAWAVQSPGARPALVQEELALFLPHDWGEALSANGLLEYTVGEMGDIKDVWKNVKEDDPKLFENPIQQENKNFYVPFVTHADKGPHAKQDAVQFAGAGQENLG